MTTRYKGLTVALDRDIRDDDIEPIVTAIRLIRGVADVGFIKTDANDWIARKRVEQLVVNRVYELIDFIQGVE